MEQLLQSQRNGEVVWVAAAGWVVEVAWEARAPAFRPDRGRVRSGERAALLWFLLGLELFGGNGLAYQYKATTAPVGMREYIHITL